MVLQARDPIEACGWARAAEGLAARCAARRVGAGRRELNLPGRRPWSRFSADGSTLGQRLPTIREVMSTIWIMRS